ITALTEETMERRGLDSFNSVVNAIPQMVLTEGNSGSGATITMRGIGSTWYNQGLEQKVAVNLDGVYYGRGRIIHEAMLDLGQVEVLKGPQSLFFGKNSSAGVISLTSKDPGDEFELIVKTGYEFENEELFGELIVSGPVNDQLGLRAAFKGSKMYGGYFNNQAAEDPAFDYSLFLLGIPGLPTSPVPLASDDEWPGDETLQGRVTAVYTPNDQWEFKLKASISSFERQGSSGVNENTSCQGLPPDIPPGFNALSGGEYCGDKDGRDRTYGQNPFPTLMAESNPDYGD
ncbi:MAG: TonB-dependent receptor plug domain-containing protein, partial [Pseudomonadales bacterium]|nr:TonB-dependent receptor plug domain-containing protein [Pseudomonadales bacterium]NIX09976.1 TonB-dependent receptor plug domain-containing protein [Pseudomonadales bacterium]